MPNRVRSRRPSAAASMVIALLVAELVAPRPAFGYIDPLSGSLVIQVVTAAVVAGALTFKRSWIRLSGYLAALRNRLGGR